MKKSKLNKWYGVWQTDNRYLGLEKDFCRLLV